MKLSVFCGLSVDGFLARSDDSFDFLNTGENQPHGFQEFLASVDVVVIGRRTFDVVLKLGHLSFYGNKPVVVLSHRPIHLFSSSAGSVEQTSGEPGRNRDAARSTRLSARLHRRRPYYSAILGRGTDRPINIDEGAGADRRRYSAFRPGAERHSSPSHCHHF